MVTVFVCLIATAFAAPTTTSTATAAAKTAPPALSANAVTLSQKDVAELLLKQSYQVKEVSAKYEQNRLALYEARALLGDWKLTIESGQEMERQETLSNQGDFRYDRYKTTVALEKSFLTGTALKFNAARTSQKSDVPGSTLPSRLTMDTALFTLEQSLWGNFFGVGDRAALNKAEYDYQATVGLRTNELEDTVMSALKKFWDTYVSQENFRESLASKDRYEKLVSAVRRKTSLGYSNPGELSQVQAEYEGRIQAVKTASIDYLKNLDELITLLNLPTGSEINFSVSSDIPPAPKLSARAIDDLRAVRSQKLKKQAAEESLSLAQSKDHPTFNLVGKVGSAGVDETPAGSYAELNASSHPYYYVGVKFEYKFGSGVLGEGVRNKRALVIQETSKYERTLNEERDKAIAAERKVAATYAIALSARDQKNYREKAVQELTRTYNQGRTDINVLIEAMNKLFTTEVQNIRALGDYQIALNEWAATRDELIPDTQEEEP